MIVAREDGTVEVYNFETTDEPILKYTYVRYYILEIRIFPRHEQPLIQQKKRSIDEKRMLFYLRMVQKVLQILKVERLVIQIMMN